MMAASNIASRIYASELRSAYRPDSIVYDPDYASLSDPELWDKVRRDPIVTAALERRVARVAGSEYRVLSPKRGGSDIDDARAAVAADALEHIVDFEEARGKAAQAVMRGSSWSWVNWSERVVSLGDMPPRRWRVPVEVRDVDRRRFEQRMVGTHPTWHLYSPARNSWDPLSGQQVGNFIRIIYRNTEDALGYGRGLLEAAYHFLYFRNELLQKGLGWADKLAFGVLMAKVDSLRDASTGKPNSVIATAWKNLLRELRTNHVAVYQQGDEVEVKEGGSQGADVVLRMIDYFDTAVTHLIIGGHLQQGSLGSGDSGSYAQSQTHRESEGDLVDRDRRKLDAAITRQLLAQFFRLNAPLLAALGLSSSKLPRFTTELDDPEDCVANTSSATQLMDRGVPMLREELYRRTGWTPPTKEQLRDPSAVITGSMQQQMAPL